MVLPVLVFAGAGCASRADRPGSPVEARLRQAAQGLCDAEALARSGQLEAARAMFFDRSHGFLHELAAMATDRDPQTAAALLEAKQRLEAALERMSGEGDAEGVEIGDLIAEVRAALGAAAVAIHLSEPACRQEEAA